MAAAMDVSVVVRMMDHFSGPARRMQATMHGMHTGLARLRLGFLGLNHAIAGAFAMMGSSAMLHGLGAIINKGNDLVKIQRDMAQAGFTAAEAQEAYARAWELTGKFQNVGTVDIMKMMNDARMIFGDPHHAITMMEPFVKAESFLRAFQGSEKGHASGEALRAEIFAAMKSGEISGNTTPEQMAEVVKQLTVMKVASGGQVNIQQYLQAQRAAGVAMRNVNDEFRFGVFPALVQEYGAGAGVMMMTAFNKVVAGVGNRVYSLDTMNQLGLINSGKAITGKSGKIKGLKPGGIKGSEMMAANPLEWVDKILGPALDAVIAKEGLTGSAASIRESQWISQMFPDRNAAKFFTMLRQQSIKLHKDVTARNVTLKAMNEAEYVAKSFDFAKLAVATQWENLLSVLGATVIPTVTSALMSLADGLKYLAEFFKDHQTLAAALTYSLGAMAAAFMLVGTILIGGWLLRSLGMVRVFATTWRGLRALLAAPLRLAGLIGLRTGMMGFAAGGPGIAAAAGGVGLLAGRFGLLSGAMRLAGAGMRLLLGPIGLIGGALLLMIPDEWWAKGAKLLETGLGLFSMIITKMVNDMVGKLKELGPPLGLPQWQGTPPWMGPGDGTFDPNAQGPLTRPGFTVPEIGGGLKPQSGPITNNNAVTMPITVNVTQTNAPPGAISDALLTAGQSVATEVKKSLTDGGQ